MNTSSSSANPYRMEVPIRRDQLTGQALFWFDRASHAQGRALNVRPSERTAFQQRLDEIWQGVDRLEGSHEVDLDRLEKVWLDLQHRWSEELGPALPPLDKVPIA